MYRLYIMYVAAKKPQLLIWNYVDMLRVKLMYDNQLHDIHGLISRWNTKCMKITEIE